MARTVPSRAEDARTARQRATPLADALDAQRINRLAHFDVPAHKSGRGNPELTEYLGERAMAMDVNSMKPLDNLGHPVSVIRDAQRLAAEAFGADDAFFMVNGTTSAVQAMIMATCTAGDEIILPRNVHRSAINALVVCGAIPVYVNPGTDKRLGIPLGMRVEDVAKAIAEHPSAKAVLVNNPTYYGICSNLVEIVKLAHAAGMRVLADEAHGTHFYFHEELPVSAMAAGCDMAAASIHKTGGSLTQSSVLLTRRPVNPDYVRQVITLTQSTSASYLLLSSLDIARKNLFFRGREMYQKTMSSAATTPSGRSSSTATPCSRSTARSFPSIPATSASPASRCTTISATTTASRSSSATSATSWATSSRSSRRATA